MSQTRRRPLAHLRDESIRRLKASERAVEAQFHEARLLASLAVALLLVGFLLVAQWRGNQSAAASLEQASDGDLAIIIQEMTAENAAMRNEAMRLEVQLAQSTRDEQGRSELLARADRELRNLRMVAGELPAVGEGVVVRIADPRRVLVAQDLVNLMHELRAGGAEAIAIDGKRVTARTSFKDSPQGVAVDGSVLPKTFESMAVGEGAALHQALSLPGGLAGTLSTFPAVQVDIERARELMLPAVVNKVPR